MTGEHATGKYSSNRLVTTGSQNPYVLKIATSVAEHFVAVYGFPQTFANAVIVGRFPPRRVHAASVK